MSYLLIRLCLYGIASLGATLVLGCLRRFPLGFIVTLSVGAYVASCTQLVFECSWPISLLLGAFAGAFIGLIPAVLDKALVGDEYAILWWMLSLGAYETISMLRVTGGQHSLTGIPPLFSGQSGLTNTAFIFLGIFSLLFAVLLLFRRSQSYNQVCLAGLNPRLLAASGQSPCWVSFKIHFIAGFLGGLAGGLWGPAYQTLHPGQFQLSESIVILLICLVGGQGEPLGVLLGLLLVFFLPRFLDFSIAAPLTGDISRALGMTPPDPAVVASSLYQAFLGLLLVLTLLFGQRGLLPSIKRKLLPVLQNRFRK